MQLQPSIKVYQKNKASHREKGSTMKMKIGLGRFGLVLALLFAFLHLSFGPNEWDLAARYWVDNAVAQMRIEFLRRHVLGLSVRLCCGGGWKFLSIF